MSTPPCRIAVESCFAAYMRRPWILLCGPRRCDRLPAQLDRIMPQLAQLCTCRRFLPRVDAGFRTNMIFLVTRRERSLDQLTMSACDCRLDWEYKHIISRCCSPFPLQTVSACYVNEHCSWYRHRQPNEGINDGEHYRHHATRHIDATNRWDD